MQAAEDWIDIRKASPIPKRSYLVASKTIGEVFDVAFFEGPREGGNFWWIMTNAEFTSKSITHFAFICPTKMLEIKEQTNAAD